jgi:hypothetical protein
MKYKQALKPTTKEMHHAFHPHALLDVKMEMQSP